MAYASSSDITTRYSAAELLIVADRDGSGTADTGVVSQALDDASNLIDSYLAERYTLPFSTTPVVLVPLCIDIAMYRMAENAGSLTDERRRRYEDAINLLRDMSKGLAGIGVDEPSVEPENKVAYSTDERVWTRTLTRGVF